MVDYKAEQEKFDKIKWLDSVQVGQDTCGEYDFCPYCVKSEQFPCARAMHRKGKKYIRLASYIPKKEA